MQSGLISSRAQSSPAGNLIVLLGYIEEVFKGITKGLESLGCTMLLKTIGLVATRFHSVHREAYYGLLIAAIKNSYCTC